MTGQQQKAVIKKYRKMYQKSIAKDRTAQHEKMQKRIGQVRTIQRLLSERRIKTIGSREIAAVARTPREEKSSASCDILMAR